MSSVPEPSALSEEALSPGQRHGLMALGALCGTLLQAAFRWLRTELSRLS